MVSIIFKSRSRCQMCKSILKPEVTPAECFYSGSVSLWPESSKTAGSVGEQKPSERAMNFCVYAIITTANEAPD